MESVLEIVKGTRYGLNEIADPFAQLKSTGVEDATAQMAKQQAYAIREIGRVRGRGTLARMGAEIIGATRKDYRLDLFAKMMGFIKSEHAIEINTGGARTAEEIEADVAALDKELEELTRKDDA